MPTPTVIGDLNTVIANNFPAGSNAPSVLDDVQRAHAAFIAQLRDRTATDWPNTPAAGVTETTVQGAIYGLEARKAALAGSITQAFNASTVNDVALLHHNDIINGDFRIAQAGTGFAAPASGAYDLDGWFNTNGSGAVFTVAQVAGSTAGRLARQVTITTADAAVAATDSVFDSTRIEGYNVEKYVGQTFTVAFRAKVPVVGIHCVALRNVGNDRSYVKEINFPTANVWQDCSFTVVGGLPTAGTWNYTNGTGLEVSFTRMSGTNFHATPNAWQTGNFIATANQVNDCATVGNVWALEKVTMNLGTVAAVSEINVGDELIRCQRYLPAVSSDLGDVAIGVATNTSGGVLDFAFLVTPRVAPTGVSSVGSASLTTGTVNSAVTAITFSSSGLRSARLSVTGTGTPYTTNTVLILLGAGAGLTLLFTGARL